MISKKTIAHRSKNTELDNGVKINMEINGNTTIRMCLFIDFNITYRRHKPSGDTFDIYHSGQYIIQSKT